MPYAGVGLESTKHVHQHTLGPCNLACVGCGAYHWKQEKTAGTLAAPKFTLCCNKGKVVLPGIFDAPATLEPLFLGETEISRRFLKKIRAYNNAFAFISLGNAGERPEDHGSGVFTYKIQGQIYHLAGSLIPASTQAPAFAQIYFLDTDPEAEITQRLAFATQGTDRDTARIIQKALHWVNPYVSFLRTAREELEQRNIEAERVGIQICQPDPINGLDLRRYNRPTASEVAAIVSRPHDDPRSRRELIFFYRDGPMRRVDDKHPSFLALRFPLLIPYGHYGWSMTIPLGEHTPREVFSTDSAEKKAALENPATVFGPGRGGSVRISQRQFHAFHLHARLQFSSLLHARNLLQEYIVDAWAMTEKNRLDFNVWNQDTLRADLYNGVRDALLRGEDLQNYGTRIVLPSSFTGSPRYWQEAYHDAMALVQRFKKPDLFITMTCNPKWPEILDALLPGQTAVDRPDLVARVFHLKLKELIEDLCKRDVLGRVVSYVYSIEFQKRGLPHTHVLLFLHEDDKFRTEISINSVVCAELPDPVQDPELHAIALAHMVHGPCSAGLPCMQNPRSPGQCSKRFPRDFRDDTDPDVDGYPQYRRRQSSPTAQVGTSPASLRTVDARWVVPYNPYLLKKFACHLNVEICTTIRAVKYLFKYVFKGPDVVAFARGSPPIPDESGTHNEISAYLRARYISPCEGTWRLYGFDMHSISPSVHKLEVHLEGQHRVSFDSSNPAAVQARILGPMAKSKLTAFFDLCASRPEETADLTYNQVCERYTWHDDDKEWRPRSSRSTAQIGRIYYSPRDNSDRFYLRMLLLSVPSPKSFEHIRCVDGIIHPTFRDACAALGMLADDGEWHLCLTEAALIRHGDSLRRLFCNIVTTEVVDDRSSLYNQHALALSELCETIMAARGIHNPGPPGCERILSFSRALLHAHLKELRPDDDPVIYGVPPPSPQWANDLIRAPAEVEEELRRNPQVEAQRAHSMITTFSPDQRTVFERLHQAFQDQHAPCRLFFINGPGGCGKTFVENAFLAYVRSLSHIAVAVAASGIAGLMLDGGRTAHSRFKIPFEVNDASICDVKAQSGLAELIRRATVIVWDEAPMQHKHCFEAVDRLFQDLRDSTQPFGGAMMVFSGDWRQTIPVVRDGTRSDQLSACLHNSYLWADVITLSLTVNLRLLRNVENLQPQQALIQTSYSNWVETISSGATTASDLSSVEIPNDIRMNSDRPDPLIEFVYGDIQTGQDPFGHYWKERSLLHAKNTDVDETNERILAAIPGRASLHLSSDLAQAPDGSIIAELNPEDLNDLRPAGLPPHRLQLKRGVPVMLMRNLDPLAGLCNGTRLIVDNIRRTVIDARILTGSDKHVNKQVFIPRINVRTGSGMFPFTLTRRQFPVKLCFAMTINKSQGQSISRVGVDLRFPCFAHGQLYVALSRATNASLVRVLLPTDTTTTSNVVIQDAIPPLPIVE